MPRRNSSWCRYCQGPPPGECLKCWSSKDRNALPEWDSALRGGGDNPRLVKGDLAGGKDPQVVWRLIQDKAYRG